MWETFSFMGMPLSWFIGFRYSRAKRKNHFISFIALASLIGIALGVMVLITVISVMNGFERELRTRILGTVPHISIFEPQDNMSDWQSLAEDVKKIQRIEAVAPYIELNAMMAHGSYRGYGFVKGIDPQLETQVSIIGDHMVIGDLADLQSGEYGIILGMNMAQRLGVMLHDKVTIIIADGATISPVGGVKLRTRQFTVKGLFETKSEVDSVLAMIHLEDAARLARTKGQVSALRVKVADVLQVDSISSDISKSLNYRYRVLNWNFTHGTLFKAIKMEKRMMFILLTFIIAVAAFNIVSTMVMVVTDKQADIAILKTLGASPKVIMSVFMVQGSINGVLGTLLGVVCGVLLAANLPEIVSTIEQWFGVSVVPGDVYFIGFLPTQVNMSDVVQIASAALLMSILATLYPAWRASRTRPAEALRYE